MSSTTLEIIQGLNQAAANGYDGAHDERYVRDGEAKKIGLSRENGCPLMDSRVIDGFFVKFYDNKMCLGYQSDVLLRDVYAGGFETEIDRKMNEIKKFLQKEYKAITGSSVTLTKDGEANIIVQSTSRVRTFVNAKQHYKISGVGELPRLDPHIENTRDVTRKFLEQFSDKRPTNDARKKGANQK
jgi:hypothetical protein